MWDGAALAAESVSRAAMVRANESRVVSMRRFWC